MTAIQRVLLASLPIALSLAGCAGEVESPAGPKLHESGPSYTDSLPGETHYGSVEVPEDVIDDGHTGPGDLPDPMLPDDPVGTLGLMTGVWELVATEDSFGPRTEVPPGRFIVIEEDEWYGPVVRFSCTGEPMPFTTDGSTVIMYEGYYELQWQIVELLDSKFTFLEGSDLFYYEQRDACPMMEEEPVPEL